MIGNKDFINDIKQYILNELSQDANFSDLNIVKAYDPQNVMKTPQVSIYIANDKEDESSNSYDSENISSLRVIFYCYNKAMRFNDDEDKTDDNLRKVVRWLHQRNTDVVINRNE